MIDFINDIVILYHLMGDGWINVRSPPRNVLLFQSLGQCSIKWYERLWHLCTSKKSKLNIIKIISISPYALCLLLDEYWVYEKSSHLCTMFWSLHSKWNHCWWAIVSFYHLQILTTQNESSYQFHCIFMLFDVRWIWLWKISIRNVTKSVYLYIHMSDHINLSPTSLTHWTLLNRCTVMILPSIEYNVSMIKNVRATSCWCSIEILYEFIWGNVLLLWNSLLRHFMIDTIHFNHNPLYLISLTS